MKTACAPSLALAAICLASGCGRLSGGAELRILLPALPPEWEASLGEIGYELRFTDPEGEWQTEEGRTWTGDGLDLPAGLPTRAYAPVIATPLVRALGIRLLPAGAILPLDVDAGERSVSLRWERGAAALLLERLLTGSEASAIPAAALDLEDLAQEMERTGDGDPWRVDADALAASVAASGGESWSCRCLATRSVSIPLDELPEGASGYLWDDALSGPAPLAEEALVLPEVPVGFHRLFPRAGGGPPASWIDLYVTEEETAWMLRHAGGRQGETERPAPPGRG